MSSTYKKLPRKEYPKPIAKDKTDAAYFKKFRTPILVKEVGAVTHIEFSPVQPHDFAVTSSTRVEIYSQDTNEVTKTFSRFKDVAYSGSFRSDGKLLVGGGEEGFIRLFEIQSKSVLRQFKGHTGAIRVTKFSPDNTHILSGSHDKTVRYWDITGESQLAVLQGHEDYVRCAAVSNASPDVWATGGYDHKIKLWDTRTFKNISSIDHGFPVEALLLYPTGSLLVSAGGNQLKIWDLLAGGKLLHTVSHHQKTITCLALNNEGNRLFSGSLDHNVKVYDVKDYSTRHTLTYPAPILSMAYSPDNSHIVVGMSDGMLSIRSRPIKMQDVVQERERQQQVRSGAFRYHQRTKTTDYAKDEYVVEVEKKVRLKEYEVLLKKFEYRNTLDAALKADPVSTVSVFEELIRRNSLSIALSGRNEDTLEPILKFLINNVTDRRWGPLILDISNTVIDIYAVIIGQSAKIDKLLAQLHKRINQEVSFQRELFELLGTLDLLITSTSVDASVGSDNAPIPLKHSKRTEV